MYYGVDLQNCIRNGHGSMFDGFMGSSIMIFLWMILIGIVIYIIVTKKSDKRIEKSAIEVLEVEFAKGNITEEEFIKKRDLLK